MPMITFKQFIDGVKEVETKAYGTSEYTVVNYALHKGETFFVPVIHKLRGNDFELRLRNEYDHEFVLKMSYLPASKNILIDFEKYGKKTLSMYGTLARFNSENVNVTHYDALRENGLVSNIDYMSRGNINHVMEQVSTFKRLGNGRTRSSDFFIHEPTLLVQSLVRSLEAHWSSALVSH